MTPECILDQVERLIALCNKHPQEIPLKDAAEYLGWTVDALRNYLQKNPDTFGVCYNADPGGQRRYFISTLPFYQWQTHGKSLPEKEAS